MRSYRAPRGAFPFASVGAVCLTGIGLVGCSDVPSRGAGAADTTEGNVSLALELPAGATMSRFHYAVTGPQNFQRDSDVTLVNSTRLTTTVNGIPATSGYHVAVTATLDDGVTPCTGKADFAVVAGAMTDVPILVSCIYSPKQGSLLVNGSLNICPRIDLFGIAPSNAIIGGQMTLQGLAFDADGAPSPLQYTWTATSGTVTNPNSATATFTCTKGGNPTITLQVSDGDGKCDGSASYPVSCACQVDSDCGANTACGTHACGANTCVDHALPANTPVQAPAGDCHVYTCDGNGGTVATVAPYETPCDTGKICDGTSNAGACQPIRFRVVRDGDGSVLAASAAAPVFVDEYFIDGSIGNTVPLPQTTAPDPGGNQPFSHALTDPKAEDSDGALTRSTDGRYLTLTGYAAPPGTTGVAFKAAATFPRVVGRIDAANGVDTSTALAATAFDGLNVRSAAATDGSGFWVGGGSALSTTLAGTPNPSGGLWYVPFKTSGGVQLGGPPDELGFPNVRVVRIFDGQLYCDMGSVTDLSTSGVFQVGAGLPSSGAPPFTRLPGTPANNNNPFGFLMLDLDGSVPGLDTLYIADADTESPNVGGIQKWKFDGTTWSRVAIFSLMNSGGTVSSNNYRGLAGLKTWHNTVTLIATTAVSTAGQDGLAVYVDDGVNPSPIAQNIVVTSGANKVFRGVALPPHNN